MIRYKINIIEALKNKNISTYKIRKENLLSEGTLTKLRNNDTSITLKNVNTLCNLLNCNITDVIEYIKE